MLVQVIVAAAACVVHPDPAPEVSAAVGDAARTAFVVTAVVAAVFVIGGSAVWSQRAHVWLWAGIVAVSGVAAGVAHVAYVQARTERICDYRGRPTIIGTLRTVRADAHAERQLVAGCAGLLEEFAGVREDIWPPASIKASETRLTWLPAVEFGALVAAVLAAGQLAGIRITRAETAASASGDRVELPTSPEGLHLTPAQFDGLSDALRDAFPNPDRLDQVLNSLGKSRAEITLKTSYIDRVFDILLAARAEGWTRKLVETARAQNPDNPKLRAWADQVGIS
jgi:hypothetical protein